MACESNAAILQQLQAPTPTCEETLREMLPWPHLQPVTVPSAPALSPLTRPAMAALAMGPCGKRDHRQTWRLAIGQTSGDKHNYFKRRWG